MTDLSEKSLEECILAITKMAKDRGDVITFKPTRMLLNEATTIFMEKHNLTQDQLFEMIMTGSITYKTWAKNESDK